MSNTPYVQPQPNAQPYGQVTDQNTSNGISIITVIIIIVIIILIIIVILLVYYYLNRETFDKITNLQVIYANDGMEGQTGTRVLDWNPPTISNIAGGLLRYNLKITENGNVIVVQTGLTTSSYKLPSSMIGDFYNITIVTLLDGNQISVFNEKLFRIYALPSLKNEDTLSFDILFRNQNNINDSGYIINPNTLESKFPLVIPVFNKVPFNDFANILSTIEVTQIVSGKTISYFANFKVIPKSKNSNSVAGNVLYSMNWNGLKLVPIISSIGGDMWTLNMILKNPAGTYTFNKVYTVPNDLFSQ